MQRRPSGRSPPRNAAEDLGVLVELLLPGGERRRDLHDGLAGVVGPAQQAAPEQAGREEAAQALLALLLRERGARLLVVP
jgi:hypothetical protein